jgi:glucose/arabinose dehydrogenase
LRIIEQDGSLNPQPVAGLPEVFAAAQAGLMEVQLDPEFASNQQIYLTYAYGTAKANNTRLAKARLVDGQLQDVQVLFSALPAKAGAAHYGGRLAFLSDNSLVLTLGDGYDLREQAQAPSNHIGKIVRLNRDGSIPKDNPLLGQAGAAVEIYSLGHRNVQGIVYDTQLQRLYSHEHGPRGGDELNLIEPGKNYGWPLITYGENYGGGAITDKTAMEGMEQPVIYWVPSIAPCGMAFVQNAKYEGWDGDLIVGSLKFNYLERCVIENNKVIRQEKIAEGIGRVRNVEMGNDGYLYVGVEGKGIYRLVEK